MVDASDKNSREAFRKRLDVLVFFDEMALKSRSKVIEYYHNW